MKRTFAFKKKHFGLCNALGTFHICMMYIFLDILADRMEIFMDDFLVFRNTFEHDLETLGKVLKRWKSINLVLNWEKCHFMLTKGIVLRYKVSNK